MWAGSTVRRKSSVWECVLKLYQRAPVSVDSIANFTWVIQNLLLVILLSKTLPPFPLLMRVPLVQQTKQSLPRLHFFFLSLSLLYMHCDHSQLKRIRKTLGSILSKITVFIVLPITKLAVSG